MNPANSSKNLSNEHNYSMMSCFKSIIKVVQSFETVFFNFFKLNFGDHTKFFHWGFQQFLQLK